jgi:hypothetical protein
MSKPEDVFDRKDLETLQQQYDPEGEARLKDLMEDIRPTRWHHEWSWSSKRVEVSGMAQMWLVIGFMFYLVMWWIPKPIWVYPVGIAIIVVTLVLWNIAVKWQAILEAPYDWTSNVFYMGGKTDAGIDQIRIWYPIVRPATPVDLQPVDQAKVRSYLEELAKMLAQHITTQRGLLRQLGVPYPIPVDQAPANPLGYALTHPKAERTFGTLAAKAALVWWPVVLIAGVLVVCWALVNLPGYLLLIILEGWSPFYAPQVWFANQWAALIGGSVSLLVSLWMRRRYRQLRATANDEEVTS